MLNDKSGNIYLSFSTESQGTYEGIQVDSGMFIAKFDTNGVLLWIKNIPARFTMNFDNQGFLIITGTFLKNFSIDSFFITCKGGSDIFLIQIDYSGVTRRVQTFGGPGNEASNALAIDSDNNIYITGSFSDSISFSNIRLYDSNNWSNFFLASFDTLMNPRWAVKGGWNQASGYDVTINNQNNVFVWGQLLDTCYMCYGGIFTSKYDNTGNLNNYITDQGSRYGCSFNLETTGHTNVYKLGYCSSTHSSTPYLTKLNESMVPIWVKTIAQDYYYSLGSAMSYDNMENIYLAGGYGSGTQDSVMIDSIWLKKYGEGADPLVAKMDSAGNFLWFLNAFGPKEECIRNISTDKNDNIFVYGESYGEDTLVFGSNTIISSGHYKHHFLAKINQTLPMNVPEVTKFVESLLIYPNPSTALFNIQLKGKNISKLCVYDLLGNCIYTKPVNNTEEQQIDLSDIARGIYFMKIFSDKGSITQKIILN
jgi:hypothetical protein